jgi:hypothetical protein
MFFLKILSQFMNFLLIILYFVGIYSTYDDIHYTILLVSDQGLHVTSYNFTWPPYFCIFLYYLISLIFVN